MIFCWLVYAIWLAVVVYLSIAAIGANLGVSACEVIAADGLALMPGIIDIHTHCVARTRGDPFGVAETLRGIAAGKHAVTNYRGLPAVSYRQMSDTKT